MTFRQQPVDTAVMAGQETKLQCQPPDSYPDVDVIWYKDATPVKTRLGLYALSVDGHHNLIFGNVQMEDAGVYHCLAYNRFTVPKSRTSNGARLTVEGELIYGL